MAEFVITNNAICHSELELHTVALTAASCCWNVAGPVLCRFYSPASVTCGNTSPDACSCSISPLNDATDFLLRSGRVGQSAIR